MSQGNAGLFCADDYCCISSRLYFSGMLDLFIKLFVSNSIQYNKEVSIKNAVGI